MPVLLHLIPTREANCPKPFSIEQKWLRIPKSGKKSVTVETHELKILA